MTTPRKIHLEADDVPISPTQRARVTVKVGGLDREGIIYVKPYGGASTYSLTLSEVAAYAVSLRKRQNDDYPPVPC